MAETEPERSRMQSEMKATEEEREKLRFELERDSSEGDQLKAKLEEIKENNSKLSKDGLRETKHQLQRQEMMAGAKRFHDKKATTTARMQQELTSVKEQESQLADQLEETLRETAEKADQKQKEFSRNADEILHQVSKASPQKASDAQDVLHHTWQMVNDMNTFCSQPDMESATRNEFKQKIVEMVRGKWVPRNKEYVENRLQKLGREMARDYGDSFCSLIQEFGAATRDDVQKSLKLASELKNLSKEEKNLTDECKAAAVAER